MSFLLNWDDFTPTEKLIWLKLRKRGGGLPDGYKKLLGFEFSSNCYFKITDFFLESGDTVKLSLSVDKACNVFGCYTSTDATTNYSLYASTSSNAKYLRYGSGTYNSYFASSNLGKRFDVSITPTGSHGMPVDDEWEEGDFTAVSDLCIGTTAPSASSAKFDGCIYGEFVVVGKLKLIPCERLSDNTLGYYDMKSGTFYTPATGTPTSLGDA